MGRAYAITQDEILAGSIMGKNYISPLHVQRYLGVEYGREELKELGRLVGSNGRVYVPELLRPYARSHILFPGYPLSLLKLRKKAPHLLSAAVWYQDCDFAAGEDIMPCWYLMHIGTVPGSRRLDWFEQQMLLERRRENEEIPYASELAYAAALYKLARGKVLFSSVFLRCPDTYLDDYNEEQRILVSWYPPTPIDFGQMRTEHDITRGSHIGISAIRNP